MNKELWLYLCFFVLYVGVNWWFKSDPILNKDKSVFLYWQYRGVNMMTQRSQTGIKDITRITSRTNQLPFHITSKSPNYEQPTKKSIVRQGDQADYSPSQAVVKTIGSRLPVVPTVASMTQPIVNGTSPPKRKSKRRNPLFIGNVEDDIPVDDPYFDHHGNITSFMKTYTQLHNSLMASRSKRCVVYLPMKETGLGNSLLALSSSFLYAALTKRAFLLNYRQFTKHFTFDFKNHNSTYTFSRRPTTGFANWNRHYNIMQPTDKSMRTLSPRMYARTPGVIVTGYLGYLQYIIRHDNYIDKLVKMGFIDPSLIKHMSIDPLSKEYDAYYSTLAMEASRNFLRHVMKLQPWVQSLIDGIVDPIQNKFLLGMHLRFGNSGGTFKDSHVFLQPSHVWNFARKAEEVLKNKGISVNDTKWILSTDSDRAELDLRGSYGDIIVTSSLFKRGHSKTGAKNEDGFTRAVIDLSLLSNCDYLILTAHSTFSVMARALSRNQTETYFMPSHGY